ncbi:MAG: DUF3667 domain-containing protein [Gemmatimonadetes bacterium]|nr:DUF3667 domain-containing protein [Gemmatimonadota bacterium]
MLLAVGRDLVAGWGRIPATIRDLTIRPGAVARGWVAGHRQAHMGPVPYALLPLVVLAATASIWGGAALGPSLEPWPYEEPLPFSGAQPRRAMDLRIWGPVLVALVAAAFRGVFSRVGWHLGEHLVLPLYLAAHWALLWGLALNGAQLLGIEMPPFGAALTLAIGLTVVSTPWLYRLSAMRALPLALVGVMAAALLWLVLLAALMISVSG